MEQTGRQIKWKLVYRRSLKEIWLEKDEANSWYYYRKQPKSASYLHVFDEAEFNMLRFLFVECYEGLVAYAIQGNKHQIKSVQENLGDIVYYKLGERE